MIETNDGTTGAAPSSPNPARRRARRRIAVGAAIAALALAGACTSSGGGTAGSGATEPGGSAGSTPGGGSVVGGADPVATSATCEVPAAASEPVTSAPVEGVASDLDLTTFDGATIRVHWFPIEGATAAAPKPTVLMGPGWGLPGDTNVDAVGVLGALNIASLREAGYNVVTWDPRGFGKSTGSAQVDSVEFEARDVQQILSWLAAQPQVELDGPGDPTSGMVGGSYGGGIQLVTGAIDCRVDALVPVIAWHSLGTSLYKADTFKQGWASILSGVSATAKVDPHVTSATASGMANGSLSEDDRQWFLDRGPADLVADITAPTLLVGGTVDTLFTLDEDIANFTILRDGDVPVAMYWFCGGHGVCLTDPGDEARMQVAIIAWLDRYVKDDESVDTGATFDFLDQDGNRYTADDYPLAAGEPITATGSGTLALTAEGGAGPIAPLEGSGGLLGTLVAPITPARATASVDVTISAPSSEQLVVGAPALTLTYSGTVPDGDRPTRLFAQLVDDSTDVVLGNQITPIPLVLDGASHEITVPLEVVSHLVRPGTTITLQLVATTTAYAQPRLGGTVDLTAIAISLPTVNGYEAG